MAYTGPVYNNRTEDRSGEIKAQGTIALGNSIAGAVSTGAKGIADYRAEVDYTNAAWDFMKERDPSLAEWDQKFTEGNINTKRTLVTQAQARTATDEARRTQQEKMAMQREEFGMRQAMQREEMGMRREEFGMRREDSAAERAMRQAALEKQYSPAEVQTADGKTITLYGGREVDVYDPNGSAVGAVQVPGTNYVTPTIGGKPTQTFLPLPKAGGADFKPQVYTIPGTNMAFAGDAEGRPIPGMPTFEVQRMTPEGVLTYKPLNEEVKIFTANDKDGNSIQIPARYDPSARKMVRIPFEEAVPTGATLPPAGATGTGGIMGRAKARLTQ